MRTILTAIAAMIFSVPSFSQNPYLYRASLVQAAPGKLLALIDSYKPSNNQATSSGDQAPMWMRHSQGDHWDLLILYPMGSYGAFHQRDRAARRDSISAEQKATRDGLIAWREDTFVYGPPLDEVRKRFENAGFFHVEMFESLPGKAGDLLREREMENNYLRRLKAPDNLIFVRDSGGAWELFTIGFYRDLKDYANSADRPIADQQAAAKAAGFEAPSQIGPYLRTLISTHHDTLAVEIK